MLSHERMTIGIHGRETLISFSTLSLAVLRPAVCFDFMMGLMILNTSTLRALSMCVSAVIH